MRIVMSWLNEYVNLDGLSVDEIAERWTLAGMEVEGIERIGDWWDPDRLRVGAVVAVRPHPNADRLVLADVDVGGDEPHQVVTGAPNLFELRDVGELDAPIKVAFAREGAELYDGYAEGWERTVLKGRKVRGIMSDAMVCSAKELGISGDHEGILVLDREAPVGAPLEQVLGDAVVTVDSLPSFARTMNMIGMARETAVLFERDLRLPETEVSGTAGKASELAAVHLEDPDLGPRYIARVVRDVSVGESPGWMARRLTLAGMRPINNIVDITNYVMLEWGEPLHAFDYDRLVERADGGVPRIVVRRAAEGETMTTLDDVERTLDADTLVIADDAGPLAIAGVMGGEETEVGPGTKNVLLEAAAFDNISIRRTSRDQRIQSESASRFGRGVHPDIAEPASRRAAVLMEALAGGQAATGAVDAYPAPPDTVEVAVPAGEIERLLGTAIEPEVSADILERLEFDVEIGAEGGLTVRVPRHRMDVERSVDVVEEVARIYGYDRLPSTTPADPLPPQRNNRRLAAEARAREGLVRLGMQEIISYRAVHPSDEAQLAAVGQQPWADDYLTLMNPISPERSSLRRSILTGLLDAAVANLRFTDRLALFELGPVFVPRNGELPDEPYRLGFVMAGATAPPSWQGVSETVGFFHGKGAVEALAASLGLAVAFRPDRHPSMHPGRTAVVAAPAGTLGHVGELHPAVAKRLDLGDRVLVVADLDFETVKGSLAAGGLRFQAFSAYPPVREDLAVIVDDTVPAGDVEAAILEAGGELLVDLTLFDVYRGEQIPEGKKSLAWSLTLQAPDRTLTSEDAEQVRTRVTRALTEGLGGTVRSG